MKENRTVSKYVPSAEDVIRIEVIELPTELAKGEGLYEWRYMSDKYLLDIFTLKQEIRDKIPNSKDIPDEVFVTHILDRIQNLRRIFVNIRTGEIQG